MSICLLVTSWYMHVIANCYISGHYFLMVTVDPHIHSWINEGLISDSHPLGQSLVARSQMGLHYDFGCMQIPAFMFIAILHKGRPYAFLKTLSYFISQQALHWNPATMIGNLTWSKQVHAFSIGRSFGIRRTRVRNDVCLLQMNFIQPLSFWVISMTHIWFLGLMTVVICCGQRYDETSNLATLFQSVCLGPRMQWKNLMLQSGCDRFNWSNVLYSAFTGNLWWVFHGEILTLEVLWI